MHEVITNNLDLWTSALLTKSSAGRGSSGKQEAYGIKKLRELILELAVRGKLVPQDPNDEPASELLKKVVGDKAQMVKDGEIRKERDFPAIADDEILFDLPDGWEWARINDMGHDWGQKTPDADFTYIDVSAIDNSLGVISAPSVLSATDAPSRARKIVRKGTVIYSTVRPYLKNICVIEENYSPEPIASTAFAILHPFQNMPGKFFAMYFRSPAFVEYVESVQTGIAYPAINDKQFYGGLVPVPPLAEQHRIVAKVDELMALCDQLEQQQTDSLEAHQTLVETLLGTLTSAASQEELTEAWTRVANHFDTLFTTEHSIEQLKQTILQLAVMGKLVPQDPNDEPASVLLERVAKHRAHIARKGNYKVNEITEIKEDEKLFVLPKSWRWARIDDLLPEFQNGASSRGDKDGQEIIVLRLADIENWKVSLKDTRTLTMAEQSIEKYSLEQDDVLIIRVNGSADIVGRFILCDQDLKAIYCDHFIRMRFPIKTLLSKYIALLASADLVRRRIRDLFISTAGQKTVNQKHIGSLVVALPPLAEQYRIAAKVDELMNLCEALKTRHLEAQTTQLHLADAIVEQAVA